MTTTYSPTGAIQYVTIGTAGTYDITAEGAAGGAGADDAGGSGASVGGDIYLAAGVELEIVVGEQGGSGGYGGGGGGGSFIIEISDGTNPVNIILAVAGGGGGGGVVFGSGGDGLTGPTGGNGSGFSPGQGGGADQPGQGGISGGGGGGGFTGGNGSSSTGGAGSVSGTSFAGGAGFTGGVNGGFGGGGGGGFTGGGGGGGYGGGGGGAYTHQVGGASGGGGGGSYLAPSVTNQSLVEGGSNAGGVVTIDLLCYLRGTRILTPSGEVPIETLHIGDQVITRFGGVRPIKWIGRQSFGGGVAGFHGDHLPVRIRAGALGPNQPARDLLVSPGHSMLIDNTLVLAKSLVNGITITQERAAGTIDYFMLDFGTHDCVLAEGAWSESFADGPGRSVHGLRGDFHNVAEFFALYPEDAPPEELVLCAPRPLRGRALEKVLAPIIACAASGIEIGPLDGCVDSILGGSFEF